MQAGFLVSLFFAIIVAVFALKNGNSVYIDFLFAKIQVSQAIVIFVSAALGAVIVTLLGLVRQLKLGRKVKEQSKLISTLENEKQLLENKIEEFNNKLIVHNTESDNNQITYKEESKKTEKEIEIGNNDNDKIMDK